MGRRENSGGSHRRTRPEIRRAGDPTRNFGAPVHAEPVSAPNFARSNRPVPDFGWRAADRLAGSGIRSRVETLSNHRQPAQVVDPPRFMRRLLGNGQVSVSKSNQGSVTVCD